MRDNSKNEVFEMKSLKDDRVVIFSSLLCLVTKISTGFLAWNTSSRKIYTRSSNQGGMAEKMKPPRL